MSATEFQVFLPTVIRTIALSDKSSSKEGSARQEGSSQDLALPSELHLTTVSLVVLSKTVLTDQEALWIAYSKLQKLLEGVEE